DPVRRIRAAPRLAGRAAEGAEGHDPCHHQSSAATAAALPPPPAPRRLPRPLQRFRPGTLAGDSRDAAPRIVFPPNGARLELAAGERSELALKISGGVQPLTLLVNGVPRTSDTARRTLFFTPDGPGFARLTVMDARGVADSVVVRIE